MIIGVDHASRRLAFVSPDTGWSARLVVRANEKDPHYRMREWAEATIPPEATLVIEAVIMGHQQIQTAIKMAYVAGMVASLRRGSTFLAPATWKMVALGPGHGHADKAEVAAWVAAQNPSAYAIFAGDQDLCDAYAIAVAGAKILEDPDVGRSATERRRARVSDSRRKARRRPT